MKVLDFRFVIPLVIAIVMVTIGSINLPEDGEEDPCPNGAANWLYVAGIVVLLSNLMVGCFTLYKWNAERDAHVDCCERCGMCFNWVIMACMGILEFSLIMWGSVVVFGAWASWTDNPEEFDKDKEAKNFCEYTPMMTAFVILILRWIEIPVMLVLRCVYSRKE